MKNLFQPLLLLIAGATQKELARQVCCLKVENEILRSKLPSKVTVTAKKKNRLAKLSANLGSAINDLVSIVHPDTLRRWIPALVQPPWWILCLGRCQHRRRCRTSTTRRPRRNCSVQPSVGWLRNTVWHHWAEDSVGSSRLCSRAERYFRCEMDREGRKTLDTDDAKLQIVCRERLGGRLKHCEERAV